MPKLDGISFLHAVMAHQPLPVIILSSVTQEGSERALEALAAGAVDVLAKPGASNSLGDMGAALVDRVRLDAPSQFRRRPARPAPRPARTGAAPVEFTDHVGSPLQEGLRLVHNTLVGAGLRQHLGVLDHLVHEPPVQRLFGGK
jgi:chemotaxis response regulator CheB